MIQIARIVAELSSEWERNLGLSRAAMERTGTWDRNAERWQTEHSAFKETQPAMYLADIKKAYPSAPTQPLPPKISGNFPASSRRDVIHRPTQIR